MSSDEKIEKKDDEKDEGPEFPAEVHPDLRWLIDFANSKPVSMTSGVTVWVKGVQMTGQVAASKEASLWFMKTWLDKVKGNTNLSMPEGWTQKDKDEFLHGMRTSFEKVEAELLPELENPPTPKRYGFLTLKNAQVWGMGGGSKGFMRVEYLRIRLDQIDAFTLGEFVAD
jgi:hypothetical protein